MSNTMDRDPLDKITRPIKNAGSAAIGVGLCGTMIGVFVDRWGYFLAVFAIGLGFFALWFAADLDRQLRSR